MSHEIDMSNDRANMAYRTGTAKPWHGLGNDCDGDLDQWRIAAGLNHKVLERPVLFDINIDGDPANDTKLIEVPNKKVLVRDDTLKPLSVVGIGYHVVQPAEVIEFYRSLIESQGFIMETAGSLMDGLKIWALASTGQQAEIGKAGFKRDMLKQYVLLATGYGGDMATAGAQTAIRVVCWNTFRYAIGEDGKRADIRIPHNAVFDADMVKAQMGLETNAWSEYIDNANELAGRKVGDKEVIEYFFDLFYGDKDDVDPESKHVERKLGTMINLYQNGVGQDTASANGTAWGLVNSVTRFVDHERNARSDSSRLNSAWFGDGNQIKNRAYEAALKLVA